jgi:hypothetical protein
MLGAYTRKRVDTTGEVEALLCAFQLARAPVEPSGAFSGANSRCSRSRAV